MTVCMYYESLPKSKPFQSLCYLLNKGTWEKEKKFHLCFVLLVTYLSRWRHRGICSSNYLSADTVLCAHGQNAWSQLFFTCQLYVMIYCIVYRIMALVSRYVLYGEKLYHCSPSKLTTTLQYRSKSITGEGSSKS